MLDTESELRDKTDLVKLKRATLDAADKEVKAMKDEKASSEIAIIFYELFAYALRY